MFSGHGYNFSIYGKSGKEPNKTIGRQHVGNLSLKYLYEDDEDNNELDEEEFEDFPKKISNKIVHSLPMTISDPGALIATDKAAGQLKNLGGAGAGFLQEFAGFHKNPIRSGISPFKMPAHSGPPIGAGGSTQAFRTTGNKIDLGSRKGYSRPHNIIDDDNERYFSLASLIKGTTVDFKQFRRQRNKIKKILHQIK